MKPHVAMPTHSVHKQVHILILTGVCVRAHTRVHHACVHVIVHSIHILPAGSGISALSLPGVLTSQTLAAQA